MTEATLTGNTTMDIYRIITEYALTHGGNTPSQRKIAAQCGLAQTTALYHINLLVKRGLLEYRDGELVVTRASFELDENAFNLASERLHPDISIMRYMPKSTRGIELHELSTLGIVPGQAADEEFLYATYPEKWSYELLSERADKDTYLLYDDNHKVRGVLRYHKKQYKADLSFVT